MTYQVLCDLKQDKWHFEGVEIHYFPFNILLDESRDEFHIASFIMWQPIYSEIFNSTMDYNEIHTSYDGSVAQGAADYITTEELDILFLDFDLRFFQKQS